MKASKAKRYVNTCFNSARGNMEDKQLKKACNIAYDEGATNMKAKAIKSYCKQCEIGKLAHCNPCNPDCPFIQSFINELE